MVVVLNKIGTSMQDSIINGSVQFGYWNGSEIVPINESVTGSSWINRFNVLSEDYGSLIAYKIVGAASCGVELTLPPVWKRK